MSKCLNLLTALATVLLAASPVIAEPATASSRDLRLERVAKLVELAPDNLDLRREQAAMLLDAGRPAEALRVIQFIEEHQGGSVAGLPDLRRRADAANSSFDARYSDAHDSEDFTIRRVDVEALRATSQRAVFDLTVGRRWLEQSGHQLRANAIGAGARYRWNDDWTFHGRIGAAVYDRGFPTRPFVNLGADWQPSLTSRAAFDVHHYDLVDDVFTLRSLLRQPALVTADPIAVNDLRGHYDYGFGPWSLLTDGSYGFLSDQNRRAGAHGTLTYRFLNEPLVALGVDARYLAYDSRSVRYWSPTDYRAFAGVVQVGQNIHDRVFWSLDGTIGRSSEQGLSSTIQLYEATISTPLSNLIDLVGTYAYGKGGRLDPNVSGGVPTDLRTYWQRHYYVGLRARRLFRDDPHRRLATPSPYEPPATPSPVMPLPLAP